MRRHYGQNFDSSQQIFALCSTKRGRKRARLQLDETRAQLGFGFKKRAKDSPRLKGTEEKGLEREGGEGHRG